MFFGKGKVPISIWKGVDFQKEAFVLSGKLESHQVTVERGGATVKGGPDILDACEGSVRQMFNVLSLEFPCLCGTLNGLGVAIGLGISCVGQEFVFAVEGEIIFLVGGIDLVEDIVCFRPVFFGCQNCECLNVPGFGFAFSRVGPDGGPLEHHLKWNWLAFVGLDQFFLNCGVIEYVFSEELDVGLLCCSG